jgi:hypothetical protein
MGQAFTVSTAPVSLAAEGRRTVTNRGTQAAVFKVGDSGPTLAWSNGVALLQPGGTLSIDTPRAARMPLQAVVQNGTTLLTVQEVH